MLCLCASTHSGSHDCCMGGAAEGCSEDAEAADEKCNSGVCIHRSKHDYIRWYNYHEIMLLNPMVILLMNNFVITHDIFVNAVSIVMFAVLSLQN